MGPPPQWQDVGSQWVRIFDVLTMPIALRGTVFAVWPFADGAKAPQPLAAGSFPIGAFSTITPGESTARVQWLDPTPPRNYVMSWNLSVQQAITRARRF